MELTRITTILFASTGLLFNLVHGQTASLTLYDNECYGAITGGPYTAGLGGIDGGIQFTGGHFMSTGDGCGADYCMTASFLDNSQCKGYFYKLGSGCTNINVGFQPIEFDFECAPCDQFPVGPFNPCDLPQK
jgi:hypothetical protein